MKLGKTDVVRWEMCSPLGRITVVLPLHSNTIVITTDCYKNTIVVNVMKVSLLCYVLYLLQENSSRKADISPPVNLYYDDCFAEKGNI